MKGTLLLFCLLIFQMSFSNPRLEGNPSYGDTLVRNKTVRADVLPVKASASPSFINKLEEKFPETDRSAKQPYLKAKKAIPDFRWANIHAEFPVPSIVNDQRGMASSAMEEIDGKGLWVDNFSNEDIIALPVGVKHDVGNVEYAIGIIKAEVGPEHTTLTVFARVTIQ